MLQIVTWLLGLLPDSWFSQASVSAQISEFISYMNFFIPFDAAITITTAWLACIVAYFVYSWAANLVDVIKEIL
ncbi:MAG: hypothetical protein NC409_11085 [Clostridium sp.]|nr:hypothetical protein [Clostridium sp.]